MKISVLAESGNDAGIMAELATEVLGGPVELIDPHFEMSGWNMIPSVLPAVIKHLHFRSEADGLIILADSNHSSLLPGAPKNRREELSILAAKTVEGLGVRHGRPRIRVAVAVAAPALEAWLLFHRYSEINESAWERGLVEKNDPYTKTLLKQRLYSVQRPSRDVMAMRRLEAAKEVKSRIHELRSRFPNGFGSFFEDILSWKSLR
jgi:hypothetical protein